MSWTSRLEEKTKQVESVLNQYLPKEEGFQKTVISAMNYSFLAGGKRLRPMLMQETYRLFGGNGKVIEPFMAAQEMIHTYSLVHDDLPAMDNDEYRRGRKTTHIVYGEGMAILAGDGLLNFAYETACKAFLIESNERVIEALQVLAAKAGIYGMIGGQTADVEGEDLPPEKVTNELLLFIHTNKTAALIQSSMMIGAILAGAGKEQIQSIEKIAYNVGVAFQIQDDILDVTSTTEVLGKPVGSDEKNHKVTYVSLNGLETSKKDVERLSKEALSLLEKLPGENPFLVELITSLITREK
ncbi:MAG: polyprenyl synthetase family protein [Lachnospiraceae bacterium]|nr:polyprenyl synthetase family protein [Lachnospiraceae bacterium]